MLNSTTVCLFALIIVLGLFMRKLNKLESQVNTMLDDYVVETNALNRRLDALSPEPQQPFIAAAKFVGFKPKYIYKTRGPQGAGYYREDAQAWQESDTDGDLPNEDAAADTELSAKDTAVKDNSVDIAAAQPATTPQDPVVADAQIAEPQPELEDPPPTKPKRKRRNRRHETETEA